MKAPSKLVRLARMRVTRTNSRRELLRMWLPWIMLVAAGFAVTWLFAKPAPPRKVVLAAGPSDGAYHWFAERYAKTFADSGIELQIVATAGSVENYRLLNAGQADLAIVQSGSTPQDIDAEIKSVASLYLEPVWVFYRGDGDEMKGLADLAGKRVAVFGEGSGTRAFATRLLEASGVTVSTGSAAPTTRPATQPDTPATRPADPPAVLIPMQRKAAVDALRAGEVDGVFMVISPSAPVVKDLLKMDGVRLLNFSRQEAYSRRFPFLSGVTLPAGIADLRSDLPPHDVRLIAPAANLVCRDHLHPAVVAVACKAAITTHEWGDLLARPNQFPSTAYVEWPMDPTARDYLKNGPPFLQRYLPFWIAALLDRAKILLLPLITLLIPVFRLAPPLYRWRMRWRIFRWYRVLQDVDLSLRQAESADTATTTALHPNLDRDLELVRDLELELANVKVPLSYMEELYNLRVHADFIRQRLENRASDPKNPPEEPVPPPT